MGDVLQLRPYVAAMTSRTASFLAGLALFGTFGLTVASLPAQTPLIGQATAVDGDTLRLGDTRIRLFGIDAPEAHQTCLDASGRSWACGEAATAALRKMLADGPVTCEPKDTDRYGRTVAVCFDPDGRSLGSRMVALGFAVDWPEYSHGAYQDPQQAAKAEHLGILVGTFTDPAEWRRRQR